MVYALIHGTANANETSTLTAETHLSTFSKFPKLPPELRLKIWGYAAWVPRIIGIRSDRNRGTVEGTVARCQLLMACKEARSEVLASRQDLHASQTRNHAKISFNPDIDTLWLTDPATTPQQLKPFRSTIKRLAIDHRLWYGNPNTLKNRTFLPRHLLMLDVEEVIVVVKSESVGENENPVFVDPQEGPGLEHTRLPADADNALLWAGSAILKPTWVERVVQDKNDLKALVIIYKLVVDILKGIVLFLISWLLRG
jgi:hypothetical protein